MLRENQRILSEYQLAIDREKSDFARELKAFNDSGVHDPVQRDAFALRQERLTVRRIRAANFPQRTADLCVTCYVDEGEEIEVLPAQSSDPAGDRFECGRCKRGGSAFPAGEPPESERVEVTGSNAVKLL